MLVSVFALLGAAPARAAVIPASGATYPVGTEFLGECDPSEQIPSGGSDNQTWETSFTYSTIQRVRADPWRTASWYPQAGDAIENWGTTSIDAPTEWSYADSSCEEVFKIDRPGVYVMIAYRTTNSYEYLNNDNEADVGDYDPDSDDELTSNPQCVSPMVEGGSPGLPYHDHTRQMAEHWALRQECQERDPWPRIRFTVTADTTTCPTPTNYSDPATQDYINQYAAGENLGLPKASASAGGKAGGNACGPSSLTMGLNIHKKAAGSTDFPELFDVYRATQLQAPADGANNPFVWTKGLAHLRSLGWGAILHIPRTPYDDPMGIIDVVLDHGYVVLVSTSFGARAWGLRGGGHVILVTGKVEVETADGDTATDYIVNDPAGNYFSSVTGHYGKTKCGRSALYPDDFLAANVSQPPRPALAIAPTPGADPREIVVVDRSGGSQDVWVQDGARRAGWIGGEEVEEPFGAGDATREPPYDSDPDADELVPPPPEQWPRAAVAHSVGDDAKVHVRGAGPFNLSISVIEGGAVVSDRTESGTLAPGEELSITQDGTRVLSGGGTGGSSAVVATSPGALPPSPSAATAPAVLPAPKLTPVLGGPRVQKLRTVLSRGIALTASCARRCRLTSEVLLRVPRKPRTILGRAVVSADPGRAKRITVRLTRAGRSALRRRARALPRRAKLVVSARVRAADAAGTGAWISRTIELRR